MHTCFQKSRSLFDFDLFILVMQTHTETCTSSDDVRKRKERMQACLEMASQAVRIGYNALNYDGSYLCYYWVDLTN